MQTHNLKSKTPRKRSNSVGRGGKRGKTSGRGTKGQKARAGGKLRPEVRDFIKRVPKMRGRGISLNNTLNYTTIVLNVGDLEVFSNGDAVTIESLVAKKVISVNKGTKKSVKILGGGEITKKLVVSGMTVSASAKEKIEKAGGTVAVK
jgi:large subunit ribosomal protein L15